MSRMVEIEKRLSMMEEKHRHVMYLVTEDRDILQNIFSEMADTLKGFVKDGNQKKKVLNANSDRFFNFAQKNHILADAYEVFSLEGTKYIPNYCFEYLEKGGQAEKASIPGKPTFFMLNDFQIIKEFVAAHFLKQFLMAAKREELESGRFVLLFLISPVMKVPKGFETEIEVLDVPEMDMGDIEGYLRFEAAVECGMSWNARRWMEQEIDLVVQRRLQEASKDFRGISRKGIQEIIADLQAEYGSFFGRADDGSGTEKNLRKIANARKQMVAGFKRNEARYDSTVTMKEPEKDAVEGLEEFLNWINDVKEEFLDVEKAYRFGNKPPKGVLLTGVPGSGKTQAAKEVAFQMGGLDGNVPLVQFRMDNLLGGLVGDSEANFKRCRKRIEALAPCIVLMDEIEKTFDTKSKSGNNDVKMNILTALLDWMQENKKQIFFFATSNSVDRLKPELLRDGRFDMRFCVFMPTHDELVKIFRLHMENANKRAGGGLLEKFDYCKAAENFLNEVTKHAKDTEKNMFYTGANVENLIKQANRILKKEKGQGPYSQKEYEQALLRAAKGKYSQPYGVTNMRDIVVFWLSAFENQYTNAGKVELFPFTAYDEEKCEFRELPKTENSYDEYMVKRISEEIAKVHKEIKEKG